MAKEFRVSLFQKGLIIVAVPLVFELIFIAVLTLCLRQAEQVANQEAHAKAVIADSNAMVACFYDSASALLLYALSQKEASNLRFEHLIKEIHSRKEHLKKLVKSNVSESKLFAPVEKTSETLLKLLVNTKKAVEDGGSDLAMLRNIESRADAQRCLQQLMAESNAFVEHAKKVERNTPIYQKANKSVLLAILVSGVIFSLLMAVLIALFIIKDFTNRLAIMSQNTMRLARGEALNPMLKGGDEITHLDHFFHQMATELTRAKNALEQSEARVRTIIDTVPVALLITDLNGTIESINDGARILLGYGEAELKAKNLNYVFPDFTAATSDDAATNMSQRFLNLDSTEKMIRCKNNESLPVELQIRELKIDDGLRVLITAMDIRERYEIAKMKREFAAMVTHDLRSPLSSLQLFLSVINVHGPVPKQIEDGAQSSKRSINRLIRLIDELMDMDKAEAGELKLEKESVSLLQLINRALESVQWLIERRKITIVLDRETDFMVFVDADRLVRVLVNLLSNAIKFSPERGSITLLAERNESDFSLHVVDQGPGVPEEFREAIFEKYRRLDHGKEGRESGSGLGLAACKLIVEAHGGQIGVQPAPNGGSDFLMSVPMRQSDI